MRLQLPDISLKIETKSKSIFHYKYFYKNLCYNFTFLLITIFKKKLLRSYNILYLVLQHCCCCCCCLPCKPWSNRTYIWWYIFSEMHPQRSLFSSSSPSFSSCIYVTEQQVLSFGCWDIKVGIKALFDGLKEINNSGLKVGKLNHRQLYVLSNEQPNSP